jgi:hypothetical protein
MILNMLRKELNESFYGDKTGLEAHRSALNQEGFGKMNETSKQMTDLYFNSHLQVLQT